MTRKLLQLALLGLVLINTVVVAQDNSNTGAQPDVGQLTVSTIDRPPFAFKDSSGDLTGFSVELWSMIAQSQGLKHEWQEHDQFSDMVGAVTSAQSDLAIANISVTASRERDADYSRPIFASGMAIAVTKDQQPNLLSLVWESGILWFLLGALLLVFLVANLVWFFERGVEDARHDYFRDDYFGGVWDAFWWAFVILTMGGFENEVPSKVFNRLIALLWIITSLFFISTLTAKITTALTVAELRTGIESYQDLKGKRVAVTAGSSHQSFLTTKGITVTEFPTLSAILEALKGNKVDAVVADLPILSYQIATSTGDWMQLAGDTFNPENYAILLPEDSPLQERIDTALLQLREDGSYAQLYTKYFGESASQ